MARRPVFICLIRPTRPGFTIDSMTPEELAAMQAHGVYHQRLRAEKKLILSGPCLDGAFGMALFEAESAEEARSIIENDPAVSSGITIPEWHPYRLGDIRVPEAESAT